MMLSYCRLFNMVHLHEVDAIIDEHHLCQVVCLLVLCAILSQLYCRCVAFLSIAHVMCLKGQCSVLRTMLSDVFIMISNANCNCY